MEEVSTGNQSEVTDHKAAVEPKITHDCPKGVDPGHMFVKDGETFCCEMCPRIEHQDNTCEFC